MNNNRMANSLVGIAGVHYVVSELSRRGLIALPTIRNTAAYDIIVATPDGSKHANIQVKTSLKRVKFWPMPPTDKICAKPNDYYVLVRWLADEKRFECFMVEGRVAKRAVKMRVAWQQERIEGGKRRVTFPAIHIDGAWGDQAKLWKAYWETWNLS